MQVHCALASQAPRRIEDVLARVRLGLLSIGFLGIVGVALATPTVGLGNVVPFVVPKPAPVQDSPDTQAPAPTSDDNHHNHKYDHNQHSDKTHQADHTSDQTDKTSQTSGQDQQTPDEANTTAIDANAAQ